MQTLYIVTGCDYVSFFKGIGKLYFMQIFFKYARFISSGLDVPGTLSDIADDTNGNGFLAFIRLVGSTYFCKHRSVFSAVSPSNLYFSLPSNMDVREKHKKWLDNIRDEVWRRTSKEEQAIPSWDALYLHWQRSTWIASYWSQATKQFTIMPGMSITQHTCLTIDL